MKNKLYGITLPQLRGIAAELGMPRFTAGQIASWLYKKNVRDIASMTDISAANRALLSEKYEVGLTPPLRETVSKDGTKKYLFGSEAGGFIEAAMIPDRDRATLCLSSQAGCRMGCDFCMTARQGLRHNLTVCDILNQFASLPERGRNADGDLTMAGRTDYRSEANRGSRQNLPAVSGLTNIVYMGMGEPLDNADAVLQSLEVLTADWGYAWSPTRITLSTAGVASALERFLDESKVHLAVSLHNPFHDERAAIMPIEKAYPIESIVELIRRRDFSHQRRVSFEYIVMKGLNDTPRHVAGLARLLNGLSCRINLIKFHKIPGSPYFSPGQEEMERFRDALSRKGITTTIRASRGEDIDAACGLLSTKGIL